MIMIGLSISGSFGTSWYAIVPTSKLSSTDAGLLSQDLTDRKETALSLSPASRLDQASAGTLMT
jgi:hypothetical protein